MILYLLQNNWRTERDTLAAPGGVENLHTAGVQECTDNHESRASADTGEVTRVQSCHPKCGTMIFFSVVKQNNNKLKPVLRCDEQL